MKAITIVAAALFATTTLVPVTFAADKADKADKKPTAEDCKKDAKMKGCDQLEKGKK